MKHTEQLAACNLLLSLGGIKSANVFPGMPSVTPKSGDAIAADMQASGILRGLAGAGIGAAGGAVVGAMGDEKKRKRRMLLGAILGGGAGAGVGAYTGADSALRKGFGENADIWEQAADNAKVPLLNTELPQAAELRRQARDMRGMTLLKLILQSREGN